MKPVVKFYLKCLLLSIPFLLMTVCYVVQDPFMVVRPYTDYDHCRVRQNEGATAWMKYQLYRNERHYDSFIMGNSCTMAFQCDDWNRYIHSRPFRLFSNAEGLGDICLKLEALGRQPHQPVRHLLIITDRGTFEKTDARTGAMYIMPPDVTGRSRASYQATFLQVFFEPSFLFPYLHYQLTGKLNKSSRKIIHDAVPTRTRFTNDAVLPHEDSIRLKGEAYWNHQLWTKSLRHPTGITVQPPVLQAPQVIRLQEIARFCRQHHTDLKLVVGPNSIHEWMNPRDIALLKRILGPQNVFCYCQESSVQDYHDYYCDGVHYRPCLGRKILRDIYGRTMKEKK